MSGLIAMATWFISNWQMIATAFSAISSISLFFMHGAAKADLAELQTFINSLQISQNQPNQSQVKKP